MTGTLSSRRSKRCTHFPFAFCFARFSCTFFPSRSCPSTLRGGGALRKMCISEMRQHRHELHRSENKERANGRKKMLAGNGLSSIHHYLRGFRCTCRSFFLSISSRFRRARSRLVNSNGSEWDTGNALLPLTRFNYFAKNFANLLLSASFYCICAPVTRTRALTYSFW